MTTETPVRRLAGRGRQMMRGVSTRRGSGFLVVDELISPLRYDVVVRAQLFESMQHADRLDESFVHNLSNGSAYALWFRTVAVARFHPHLLTDDAAFTKALNARIRSAVRLWLSFAQHGFDVRHPIYVRPAMPGATTTSGKRLRRAFHVSDGCHRLALLLASGHHELPPSHYRIDPRQLLTLPDNTTRLLAPLAIDEATYASYIARGFGLGPARDVPSLLAVARERGPQLLADIAQIVSADISNGLRVSSDALAAVDNETWGGLAR